jgi:RNA recognition motif-containing protein
MPFRLHIDNVAPDVTEDDLREEFEMVGEVIDLKLLLDDLTERPTGTAMVQMATQHDADQAVRALDGARVGGRTLRVHEEED